MPAAIGAAADVPDIFKDFNKLFEEVYFLLENANLKGLSELSPGTKFSSLWFQIVSLEDYLQKILAMKQYIYSGFICSIFQYFSPNMKTVMALTFDVLSEKRLKFR